MNKKQASRKGLPKYVGLHITPENRLEYVRKYGHEEVSRQIKMFREYLKGKTRFIWKGTVVPVMTEAILSQNKFKPEIKEDGNEES